MARFERFWKVYPKRKAKDDAWRAWQKRKPDDALTDVIVRAVQVQCRGEDWLREGGKYIPHPATWLNAGRWKDEAPLPFNPGSTVRTTPSPAVIARLKAAQEQAS